MSYWTKLPSYRSNHVSWGSPEHRQILSTKAKQQWRNSMRLKQLSESVRRAWMSPSVRRRYLRGIRRASRKVSIITRRKLALAGWTEERRIRQARTMRITLSNPEVRKRYSVAQLGRPAPVNVFRDTKPERVVEIMLRDLGFRFKKQQYVGHFVTPDFVIGDLLIFVDGCFWHGCPIHHPDRGDFFRVTSNVKRDREVTHWVRRQSNYRVVRIWEHELRTIEGREFVISRIMEGDK
jgi:DNA mismatch endonuclease Vsr